MNHVFITNWSDYALYTCNLSNLSIYIYLYRLITKITIIAIKENILQCFSCVNAIYYQNKTIFYMSHKLHVDNTYNIITLSIV